MKEYVSTSLETHLFFGRIMKEHALFLLAAFPAGETEYKYPYYPGRKETAGRLRKLSGQENDTADTVFEPESSSSVKWFDCV